VSDYLDRTVPAIVAETSSTPVFDIDGPLVRRFDVASQVSAPVTKGQVVGAVIVTQGARRVGRIPVVAAAAVPAPGAWEAFTIWTTRLWRGMFGGPSAARSVAAPTAP